MNFEFELHFCSIARHSLTSYVNFSDAESTNWPCARTKNQRRE